MTAKDVKKAMEIRIHNGSCAECAYAVYPMDQCQVRMFKDALDIINNYEAEIESLKNK